MENLEAFQAMASTYSIIGGIIGLIGIIALWKVFTKANEPGWAAIVPFYNAYVFFKIAFGNGWLFLTLLIPFANIIIGIVALFKLAKAFNKGAGFGFGLWLLNPIFMLLLAFGDAEYQGA